MQQQPWRPSFQLANPRKTELRFGNDRPILQPRGPMLVANIERVYKVVETGDGHCLWHCLCDAFNTFPDWLHAMMELGLNRATMEDLFRMEIATAEERAKGEEAAGKVKSAYRQKNRYADMNYSGTTELLLLSYARLAQWEFRTVKKEEEGRNVVRYDGRTPAQMIAQRQGADDPRLPVLAEVTMEHQNLDHWNLFVYRMKDGKLYSHWWPHPNESPRARARRYRMIHAAMNKYGSDEDRRSALDSKVSSPMVAVEDETVHDSDDETQVKNETSKLAKKPQKVEAPVSSSSSSSAAAGASSSSSAQAAAASADAEMADYPIPEGFELGGGDYEEKGDQDDEDPVDAIAAAAANSSSAAAAAASSSSSAAAAPVGGPLVVTYETVSQHREKVTSSGRISGVDKRFKAQCWWNSARRGIQVQDYEPIVTRIQGALDQLMENEAEGFTDKEQELIADIRDRLHKSPDDATSIADLVQEFLDDKEFEGRRNGGEVEMKLITYFDPLIVFQWYSQANGWLNSLNETQPEKIPVGTKEIYLVNVLYGHWDILYFNDQPFWTTKKETPSERATRLEQMNSLIPEYEHVPPPPPPKKGKKKGKKNDKGEGDSGAASSPSAGGPANPPPPPPPPSAPSKRRTIYTGKRRKLISIDEAMGQLLELQEQLTSEELLNLIHNGPGKTLPERMSAVQPATRQRMVNEQLWEAQNLLAARGIGGVNHALGRYEGSARLNQQSLLFQLFITERDLSFNYTPEDENEKTWVNFYIKEKMHLASWDKETFYWPASILPEVDSTTIDEYFECRQSEHVDIPGVMGIFLKKPLPREAFEGNRANPAAARFRFPYAGAIMTNIMASVFEFECECPTGIALDTLGESSTPEIKEHFKNYTLVGDPTCFAAIINSVNTTGVLTEEQEKKVNCKYLYVPKPYKNGQQIPGGAIYVAVTDRNIKPKTELLIDYGKIFWDTNREGHVGRNPCEVCQTKFGEEDQDNKTIPDYYSKLQQHTNTKQWGMTACDWEGEGGECEFHSVIHDVCRSDSKKKWFCEKHREFVTEEEANEEEFEEDPDKGNDDFCALCNQPGDLIMCDRCVQSYHETCLTSRDGRNYNTLKRMGKKAWFECKQMHLRCVGRKLPYLLMLSPDAEAIASSSKPSKPQAAAPNKQGQRRKKTYFKGTKSGPWKQKEVNKKKRAKLSHAAGSAQHAQSMLADPEDDDDDDQEEEKQESAVNREIRELRAALGITAPREFAAAAAGLTRDQDDQQYLQRLRAQRAAQAMASMSRSPPKPNSHRDDWDDEDQEMAQLKGMAKLAITPKQRPITLR